MKLNRGNIDNINIVKKGIEEGSVKKQELLKPKIDIVFHALFNEKRKYLLDALLSAILREQVKVLTTDKNRYVDIASADEKFGILDLRAQLEDGAQCLIEIQLEKCKSETERILYYWSNSYTRQLNTGDGYEELNKTISIVILDHEIKELKGVEELGMKWHIRDDDSGKRILTKHLEIIIIELPKAMRIYKKNRKEIVAQWMMFLDNPNRKEMSNIVDQNEKIKEAVEELEKIGGDDIIRRMAEYREKAARDKKAIEDYHREIGIKQGVKEGRRIGIKQGIKEGKEQGIKEGKEQGIKEGKEQGIKEGKEQGIKEGKEQGIKEGKEQGIKEGKEQGIKEGKEQGIKEGREQCAREMKKDVVLKMLDNNIDINVISTITSLSEEEIEYISKSK